MIRQLLLSILLIHATLAAGQGRGKIIGPPPKKWSTLKGTQPVIVARGGFSGVAPESSQGAIELAQMSSLPSTIVLCDLQLTKDGEGFCLYDMNLANSTNINTVYPNQQKSYIIEGKDVKGWFGFDYTAKDLFANIALIQSVFSRTYLFDNQYQIGSPLAIKELQDPPRLWINVQRPTFYDLRKLSPALYIQDYMQDLTPAYISSPEIGFLKGLGGKINKVTTKLVFRFLGVDEVEPTTKEKYGSLMKDLPMIKSFASGIIVPKDLIWPMDDARILQPASTIVSDAHKAGLEVYGAGFANDNYISYNYSYDPIKEYLQFVDNSQFSIDGIITDFPATASEAIACLAQNPKPTRVIKTLVISHDGSSGDFPGSTDLAYQKAIDDGVDIIDCSVQMSKDGVAFCSPNVDLSGTTTATTFFLSRAAQVPEIKAREGIYSFDLTWTEIQTLKPQLVSPYEAPLNRNPSNKNKGKIITLPDFLDLAKQRKVPGILISIENAPYLASKKGLDIVDVVITALNNATFDKQPTQKVLIQSDDSSVLTKFNDFKSYQRVLNIIKEFSSAAPPVAEEIKKYADAIRVFRNAIVLDYPAPVFMSRNYSNLVDVMHAANVSVYVGALRNEFQNFLFDYYADPYVEIATHVQAGVDGIVTDFPATAVAYMNSPCANQKADLPYTILPILPGDMFNNAVAAKPPEAAPMAPPMETKDVADPPLPPVVKVPESTSPPAAAAENSTASPPAPSKSLASEKLLGRLGLIIVAIVGALSILDV